MTFIRQPSFFSIQELYDMEPTQKYGSIISAIDLDAIHYEVSKKSRLGAPTELNYTAMIITIFIRYIERIPTIKDLIKRLNNDIAFKLNCGILVSDNIPSEASYSRLLTKLSESNILVEVQEKLVLQAVAEGYIVDDTVAIDATHFEARDQAPAKEEKPKSNFDSKYETLKYTQPKECRECPLANEVICQKVFKMKITIDLRRYTAPARGSQAWQNIYNRRTAVEQVNGYLKIILSA